MTIGLEAKAYDYGMGHVGEQTIKDLNKELDLGHSAVAKVINPHTGHPHYIYVAGRDKDGKYIIGDQDRKNAKHFKPVAENHLLQMMKGRDGFVAGWSHSPTAAARREGSAAYRFAELTNNSRAVT